MGKIRIRETGLHPRSKKALILGTREIYATNLKKSSDDQMRRLRNHIGEKSLNQLKIDLWREEQAAKRRKT